MEHGLVSRPAFPPRKGRGGVSRPQFDVTCSADLEKRGLTYSTSLPLASLLPTSQKSREHRYDYASVTVNLNIVT
ncbi:hypothetical protein DUI87_06998 [Hirundo rustica rustica]|uniref:Uncharacterized protein n=1 Tax=Hirundo rustica rustica TaxID=333673 RepID=A0A3M0KNL6_HIRRU|nr:hypothetical protein DUI87_06998 [Hirundo rustica rustica]